MKKPTFDRIQDHAVIGDGRSAALVARDGTIDWLAWPRFDSPSLFASLLDSGSADSGFFRFRPTAPLRSISRQYATHSNMLVTRLETDTGMLELTDSMSIPEEPRRSLMPEHELLRVACVVR